MTTTTLTPVALTASVGTVTPTGGTVPGILTDASDNTYVLMGDTGATARFSLTSLTLGTGRLKYWTITLRAKSFAFGYDLATKMMLPPSGTIWPQGSLPIGLAANTHTTSPFVPPSLVQTEIDDLEVQVEWPNTGGVGGVLHLYELSVSVNWATVPTANITYPTGVPALGTSSPTVAWTHAPGSDGGPQVFAEVKVFTAAQYGAGGFSPDTSTAAYSTVVSGPATSKTVGPLANNTTFRVYVRTAQYINGGNHWSPWDFEGFSTAYSPSTVSTVTPVADNTNGLMTVTIARNTGTAAWTSVELERTDDAGVTWVPVRGATGVKTTNTHTTTWSANSVVVKDHEAPNGGAVTYRARATTSTGVVGDWVSSAGVQWSHATDVWLKDPHDPVLNIVLDTTEVPSPTRSAPQGVFEVVGSVLPNVVADVRRGRVGSLEAMTVTKAAGDILDSATASPFKLLQYPATQQWGSKYIALGDVQEIPLEPTDAFIKHRLWRISYVQIARPADHTVY